MASATRTARRAAERQASKLDPKVAAKIADIKGANGAPKLEDILDQLPPPDPNAPNPDQIPEDLRKALEDGAAGPNVSKLVTGKRQAKFIALEKELAALLCIPAIPFDKMGDEFCANHFATQGPMLAMQLTVYSESHKATYETLRRLVEAGGILTLSVAVSMYAIPPILHHMKTSDKVKSSFGVPVSGEVHTPDHAR